jgi:hypothetical protein
MVYFGSFIRSFTYGQLASFFLGCSEAEHDGGGSKWLRRAAHLGSAGKQRGRSSGVGNRDKI